MGNGKAKPPGVLLGSRRSRRHRANLKKPKHIAKQKICSENRMRKQNYRYLQYVRQSRQISHEAQEELKLFFKLSIAEQAKVVESKKLSNEAKQICLRLGEERRMARAKVRHLIPGDWFAEERKWNGRVNQSSKGKKGKEKMMEGKEEGGDEREMRSNGGKEKDEDNDINEVKEEGRRIRRMGGFQKIPREKL